MNLSVDVHDLERIRGKLQPALVRDPAQDMIRDAASFAVRQAQANAPRDTGAIAQSIHADVHELSARVRSTLPGALAVEFGRRPGQSLPPPRALRVWAARHGLAGLEFVIARAIARRGIKGRFFMRRAREKLLHAELPRLVNIAAGRIADIWKS